MSSSTTAPIAHTESQQCDLEHVITVIEHGPDVARRVNGLHTGCTVAVCTYKRAESLRRLLDSIAMQTRRPDQIVIVDASPGAETEAAIRTFEKLNEVATSFSYYRVDGPLRGLTRQRNFALHLVGYDLVVYFDDDVVLEPDCLQEMENAHRHAGGEVVGVGAYMQNESRQLNLTWRWRRLFRMTPSLDPGRYFRSGMATPWRFLKPTDELVEGNWLTGYAMMWKAELAKEVRFNSFFYGYSSGEDLDFSLRMGRHGKLCVAGKARADHLHESAGRPNAYQLGRMSLRNSYSIHRRCIPNRTWRDTGWFFYAYSIDTLFHILIPPRPKYIVARAKFVLGRLRTMLDIVCARVDSNN